MYENIDRLCGLHQRVQLLYVVDGYIASLEHEDGYPYPEVKAYGESIHDALLTLDAMLSTYSEWRK